MTQQRLMTYDEESDTLMKAIELRRAGDHEGFDRLMRTVPVPPYMAKVIKDKLGLDFLLSLDRNLAEAEAKFGSSFFNN